MNNLTDRHYFEECITAMITNPEFVKEYVFYSSMIAQCKIQFEDIPAPAGVSFCDTYYILYINNEEFGKFTLKERIGILKHEMLHILNNHVQRGKIGQVEKDQYIWNVSTDLAINQLIKREHLPDAGIHIADEMFSKFEKLLSSEMYYELLLNESKNNQKQEKEEKEDSKSPDHSTWEKTQGNPEVQKDVTKKMIETSIEKAQGNVSKDILDSLKLFQKKAKVNWKKALRNLTARQRIGHIKTIQRLDRRFPMREDLKGNKKDNKFNLLVVLDISGSMENKDILLGLNEIYNICKLNKSDMKLIQVDSEIKGVETYTPKSKLFKRKGMGGTKLFPAIKYIKENKLNPDGLIIITDGYCENISLWEYTPKCKTIFLGTTDKKPNGFDSCKNKKYTYYNIKETK